MTQAFNAYDPVEERQARYAEIMELVAKKVSYREIGRRFGISAARVGQIVHAGAPGLAGWAGHRASEDGPSSP